MKLKFALFGLCTAAVSGYALAAKPVEAPGGKFAAEAEQMYRDSFREDSPKEWMQRLVQDDTMKTCGIYRDNPPRKIGEKLEKPTRRPSSTRPAAS